jgi:hypothetical protein
LGGLVFDHMEVILFQQGKSMVLKDGPSRLFPGRVKLFFLH